MTDGGYDVGYAGSECFWGRDPGSLLLKLRDFVPLLKGLSVLDVGCGEGKNASYAEQQGATVTALDVSEIAIDRAKLFWPNSSLIRWSVADLRAVHLEPDGYNVIIAYGVFHCLNNEDEIIRAIVKLKDATCHGGVHVICTFNDRFQQLNAHPGFSPCLLKHEWYLQQYADWDILYSSDADLTEVHPHNQIKHTHSLTRIIARRC